MRSIDTERYGVNDGHVDAHENHLMRRLADLLHVRRIDAISAKLRAERDAGGMNLTTP